MKQKSSEITASDIEPGYEALSYVWGNPEDTVPIFCSGCEIKVTRNLATALRYFRQTQSMRRIWADAICINQRSLTEKAQQVQQMGRVYASAVQTLVWLGEESLEVKGALENLPIWLRSPAPHVDWTGAEIAWESPSSLVFNERGVSTEAATWLRLQQESLPPVMSLFARDWWRRKWIIQELVRAKSAVLVCGKQHLEWASIQRNLADPMTAARLNQTCLLINLMQGPSDTSELQLKSQTGMANAVQMAKWTSAFHREGPSEPENLGLLDLTWHTLGFECTVAVDSLYSLLGLVQDVEGSKGSHLLAVDYTASFAEISTRFTKWIILNSPPSGPLGMFNHVLGNRKPFTIDKRPQSEPARDPNQLPPSWASGLLHSEYFSRMDLVAPLGIQDFDAGGSRRGILPTNPVPWKEPSTNSDMLALNGRIIGTITDLFPPLKVDDNLYSYEQFMAWSTQIWDLVSARTPEYEHASEVFYQFVTCGGESSRILSKIPSRSRPGLEDARRYLTIASGQDHELFAAEPNVSAFMEAMAPATCRRLCVTSSGHLGWVPPVAEKGDRICIFDGAPLFYVITPCGGGYHNLIGPCYVQGLMFGEAVDLDLELQKINLY